MRHRLGAFAATGLGAAVLLAACSSGGPTNDVRPTRTPPRPPLAVHIAHTVGGAQELVADVRPRPVDPAAARPVARTEQAFTVSLLQHLGTGGGNLTVSPASLAIALSMLENGTAGATRSQLAAAMAAGTLPLPAQNAGWQALVAAWSRAAGRSGLQLHSANAVWAQRHFPIRASYLAALRDGYGAGVWQVDFRGHPSDAVAAIDAWCAQQTNGRITKLFDGLDPSTVAVLANAVYFNAQWQTPFESPLTSPEPFTTAAGARVQVPTMHSSELTAPAAVTPHYDAVQLPYRGGRFAALAIMPTAGSLADFVSGLGPADLQDVVDSLHPGPVDVTMPKFTTTSTLDLVAALRQLGVRDAFAGGDFSPMSPAGGLGVSDVVQRDYLSVSERGTEAAAVTGIAIASSATYGGLTVHLDHPFLFLVRDTTTGAVLFASEVSDPGSG